MKKTVIALFAGIAIGMALSASIAYAVLPNDVWSRMFNSYVETDSGNVAVRAHFEL